DPEGMLTILVALARCGDKADLAPLLSRLNGLNWQQLTEMQRLEMLRVYSLAVLRLGKPESGVAQEVVAKLSPHLPAPSFETNRELSALLLVFGAPDAVSKTMALLRTAPTPREQVAFAYNLRPISSGWKFELRKEYFEWYKLAANYRGG